MFAKLHFHDGLRERKRTLESARAAAFLGITTEALKFVRIRGGIPGVATAHGFLFFADDVEQLRQERAARERKRVVAALRREVGRETTV
jgi:hypothetical protein